MRTVLWIMVAIAAVLAVALGCVFSVKWTLIVVSGLPFLSFAAVLGFWFPVAKRSKIPWNDSNEEEVPKAENEQKAQRYTRINIWWFEFRRVPQNAAWVVQRGFWIDEAAKKNPMLPGSSARGFREKRSGWRFIFLPGLLWTTLEMVDLRDQQFNIEEMRTNTPSELGRILLSLQEGVDDSASEVTIPGFVLVDTQVTVEVMDPVWVAVRLDRGIRQVTDQLLSPALNLVTGDKTDLELVSMNRADLQGFMDVATAVVNGQELVLRYPDGREEPLPGQDTDPQNHLPFYGLKIKAVRFQMIDLPEKVKAALEELRTAQLDQEKARFEAKALLTWMTSVGLDNQVVLANPSRALAAIGYRLAELMVPWFVDKKGE